MDDDPRRSRHSWLVNSLTVLAMTLLAGCGIAAGTMVHQRASVAATLTEPVVVGGLPSSSASSMPASSDVGSGVCVTTAAMGSCGPYDDSRVAIGAGKLTVGQDVWHQIAGWSQELHA